MKHELNTGSDQPLKPGRYGNCVYLGAAELGNPTDEESTWPVVQAKPIGHFTVIEGDACAGNPTEEELSWPVVQPCQSIDSRPETQDQSSDCKGETVSILEIDTPDTRMVSP
jgi:hypothetical protein